MAMLKVPEPYNMDKKKLSKADICLKFITPALVASGWNVNEQVFQDKQFSPDFFDLVIFDECHHGSAAEDSTWRESLTYA